jgi:hypothetical protein
VASRKVAPRSTSWPFSGRPLRCAPTTAIGSVGRLAGHVVCAGDGECAPAVGLPRPPPSRASVAPSGSSTLCLPAQAEAGERGVARGRPDEGDAERQPVAREAGRQRQRAPAEQVDEVGVAAELGVDADRVGIDLGVAWMARRGRHHQQVDVVPERADLALCFAQRVEAAERVGRRQSARRFDHGRTLRSKASGCAASSASTTAWRSATHGPAVEQRGDRVQRFEIERDHAVAERLQVRDRALVRPRRSRHRR